MKLHKDDPRLLQFVLNEISDADRSLILKAMAEQPEIELEIQQLRITFRDIESLSLQPKEMKLTSAQRVNLFNQTINSEGSVGFLAKFRQSISIWTLSGGGLIAAMFAVLVFNNVLQTEKNKRVGELGQVQNELDVRTEPLPTKSKGLVQQDSSGIGAGSSGGAAKKMDSSEDLNLAELNDKSSRSSGFGSSTGIGGSASGGADAAAGAGSAGSSANANQVRAKLAESSAIEMKDSAKKESSYATVAPAADSAQSIEPEVAQLEEESASFQADEAPAEVAVSQSAPAAPAAAFVQRGRPSGSETADLAKGSAALERKEDQSKKVGLKSKAFTAVARRDVRPQLIQLASENEKLASRQSVELLNTIKTCVPELDRSAIEFNLVFYFKNKTVVFENEKTQLTVAQKNCLIMKLGAYSWPKAIDYRFKVFSVSK